MIEPREGSSLHYSLLWIDKAKRQRFLHCLSLINALAQTLEEVQEPSVAEQKIHWWHEELERLVSGNARHPATQACQTDLLNTKKVMDLSLTILSVASTEKFTPVATDSALNALYVQGFRARLALLSYALTKNTAELNVNNHPEMAALAFGLHEQLSRLPRLIHRGLPVFSNETYEKFNIKPQDLAKHIRVAAPGESPLASAIDSIPVAVDSPERVALIEHAIEHALALLQQAVANQDIRTRYRQSGLLPVWRLLVLRHLQLKLWHKRKPDLLRERITLTPLTKLFRAWQHRR